MASIDSLKEDILDVFSIFDEDNSGSISVQELIRALYTITGLRFSRAEVRAFIQAVQEDVKGLGDGDQLRQPADGLANGTNAGGNKVQNVSNEPDAVDSALFVAVVLKALNRRTYEQELLFVFHLLEDKNYPGFITKDSLKLAAADIGEPLTDREADEMFDKLVTGAPTSAIDFLTFSSILDEAKTTDE